MSRKIVFTGGSGKAPIGDQPGVIHDGEGPLEDRR